MKLDLPVGLLHAGDPRPVSCTEYGIVSGTERVMGKSGAEAEKTAPTTLMCLGNQAVATQMGRDSL